MFTRIAVNAAALLLAGGLALAAPAANAATITTQLVAPAGPYNLGNPVGNIPSQTLAKYPSLRGFYIDETKNKNNKYNFVFTISPGTYDLHTTMSAFAPVLGPLPVQYRLLKGVPGQLGNLLLGVSPLALNPSIDVDDVTGGNYFMQLLPSGVSSPKKEEWVNGQIELTVPEPATWGMMILGVGMLGLAARRRRAVSGLAA